MVDGGDDYDNRNLYDIWRFLYLFRTGVGVGIR